TSALTAARRGSSSTSGMRAGSMLSGSTGAGGGTGAATGGGGAGGGGGGGWETGAGSGSGAQPGAGAPMRVKAIAEVLRRRPSTTAELSRTAPPVENLAIHAGTCHGVGKLPGLHPEPRARDGGGRE